jgi:3-oxoacyl-[acyl-carrier protein] reductase
MDMGLAGRVAIVTGGSRGIGRSIAAALVREGARVVLCARNHAALEAAAATLRGGGGEVLAHVADVSKAGALDEVVAAALERWGRLDILVNNAGGPPPGAFDECGDLQWRSAFDLSLMSVVWAVREAVPHLAASGSGRIVNVLSVSVKEPQPGLLLSNSLRVAVAGLAKTLSRELAPSGITVNNVCPGHVMTARLREVAAYRAARGGAAARDVVAAIPLKRLGAPEEVADLVTYLASQRAGYVTGVTIPVDGGSTVALT